MTPKETVSCLFYGSIGWKQPVDDPCVGPGEDPRALDVELITNIKIRRCLIEGTSGQHSLSVSTASLRLSALWRRKSSIN